MELKAALSSIPGAGGVAERPNPPLDFTSAEVQWHWRGPKLQRNAKHIAGIDKKNIPNETRERNDGRRRAGTDPLAQGSEWKPTPSMNPVEGSEKKKKTKPYLTSVKRYIFLKV